MPVEVTNTLSPLMQAIADARETVRKCESDVEEKKAALKLSKATLEEAQGGLNLAVDAAIEAERQPTLFSRFGVGDDLTDPPEPAKVTSEVVDAEYVVNPDSVPSLEASGTAVDVIDRIEKLKRWRTLDAAEELEIPDEIKAAFKAHGVITLGDLADALLAGKTFGLKLVDVEELKDGIEQCSSNDDEPIVFPGLEADPEEPDEDEEPDPTKEPKQPGPAMFGQPVREDFADDKTGNWEAKFARLRFQAAKFSERDERLAKHLAHYRGRQEAGEAQSQWGKWSEFDVAVKAADGTQFIARVLYKPDWIEGTEDHLEIWSDRLSPTGYWSDVVTHLKGKRPKLPLAEWCREWAQKRCDDYQIEQKRAKGNKGKKKDKTTAA